MSYSYFPESDVDELPYEAQILQVDAAGASLQLELHSEADMRRAVLKLAENAGLGFNETRFPHPDVPPDSADVTLLELSCQTFAVQFMVATKYLLSRQEASKTGKELSADTSLARECGRCKNRWPTFWHFLLTPTPPLYLRCAMCMKRIPVGHDIRTIPMRKAQPNIVDMQGRAMQLSGKILNGAFPRIDTRQQCVAEDCPLKNVDPHRGRPFPDSFCLFVNVIFTITPRTLHVM